MPPCDDSPPPGMLTGETVRLFPLPNLVMFPHVMQALHIFEPRYCDLVEEALETDKRVTMVLLAPGWEHDYEGRPPIAPVACVGKIVAHERLPTGRHNILLHGLQRVAIRRELPVTRSFRQAEVEPLDDIYTCHGATQRPQRQRQLVELARQLLPDSPILNEQLDEVLAGPLSLGMLTDIFGFTLGFAPSLKQRLLAEPNVDRRATLLANKLAAIARHIEPPDAESVPFPPRFSVN